MRLTEHEISLHTLSSLLHGFADIEHLQDVKVTGINCDSRKIKQGDLFIAHPHLNVLSHISAAVKSGANAVTVPVKKFAEIPRYNIPIVALPKLCEQAGLIASRFFGNPSNALNVIGITGTNGKTTVSHLIAQALDQQHPGRNGTIGTLGYGSLKQLSHYPNTTPGAIDLQRILATLHQQKIDTVTMEVTSHGLDQHRVSGVKFNIAVFTNLTRDHLDYHKNMDAYMGAKRRLFRDYAINKAVINVDDVYGAQLYNELRKKIDTVAYTFNTDKQSVSPTIVAKILHSHNGLKLQIFSPWGNGVLCSDMIGRFNAENLLASLAVLCLLNIKFKDALSSLSRCTGVAGRMEFLKKSGNPVVVVDYAHTPDSLKKVLQTLQSQASEKLICVFGCGGERDKGKRSEMGIVAEMFADHIFLTNDNPRYESPQKIIDDIAEGIENHTKVTKDTDRKHAIEIAIQSASQNDLVLIAGKGNEDYQEINGTRIAFSDRTIVKEIFCQPNSSDLQ